MLFTQHYITLISLHLQVLQNIEDIKMKEMQIFEYKKRIAESETKLKQQQNLYEDVRTERNLFSKNLIEAKVSVCRPSWQICSQ